MASRPHYKRIRTSAEFLQWYWLKSEMQEFCRYLGVPYSGSKFTLRDRIAHALDHSGQLRPARKASKKAARKKDRSGRSPAEEFNWARAKLTPQTKITPKISFGPHTRRFVLTQIQGKFTFYSEFMAWARANPGKTLADAVVQWRKIDADRRNPAKQTRIAAHNMLNQYVRAFLADNPGCDFKVALKFWKLKRRCPAPGGFVKYESSDLKLS